MSITAVGERIIVKKVESDSSLKEKAGGFILPDNAMNENEKMEVVSVGEDVKIDVCDGDIVVVEGGSTNYNSIVVDDVKYYTIFSTNIMAKIG